MCGSSNVPSFDPPPPPPKEADYRKAANDERDKAKKRIGLNRTILTDALGNTSDTLNTEKKTLLGQ